MFNVTSKQLLELLNDSLLESDNITPFSECVLIKV